MAHVHGEVSEELRRRFKAACSRNGRTAMAVLKDFIQEYVEKQEGIPQ